MESYENVEFNISKNHLYTLSYPFPEKLQLTQQSKKLFEIGRPDQGYIGTINLTTGEIHLLPAFNKGDGLVREDKYGNKFQYALEHFLPRMGGGIMHGMALLSLNIDPQLSLDGKIMGFGITKGNNDLIQEARSRSGKSNPYAVKYDEKFMAWFSSKGDGEGNSAKNFAHTNDLHREIPEILFTRIFDVLNNELCQGNCSYGDVVYRPIKNHGDFQNFWVTDTNSCLVDLFQNLLKENKFNRIDEFALNQNKDIILTLLSDTELTHEQLKQLNEEFYSDHGMLAKAFLGSFGTLEIDKNFPDVSYKKVISKVIKAQSGRFKTILKKSSDTRLIQAVLEIDGSLLNYISPELASQEYLIAIARNSNTSQEKAASEQSLLSKNNSNDLKNVETSCLSANEFIFFQRDKKDISNPAVNVESQMVIVDPKTEALSCFVLATNWTSRRL